MVREPMVQEENQPQTASHHILKLYSFTTLKIGARHHPDFFDSCGRLLLAKGMPVTPRILEALLKREIYVLYTEWLRKKANIFSRELHNDAIENIRIIFKETQLLGLEQYRQVEEIVDRLVQELEENSSPVFEFNTFRQFDNYTYVHSVNVALVATIIGITLGYSGMQLRQLALGAMLHDIGKMQVPTEVLNKPEALSDEEYELIKKHPLFGEEALSNIQIAPSVLETIRQHHERWNGSGYPDGIQWDNIHLNAQITAVADVFDATIADRPYRQGMPPYHAVELIVGGEGSLFSPRVVDAFLSSINLYPPKSRVTLNSGETGIVIEVPRRYPTRPRVKLLLDGRGKPVKNDMVVDLMTSLNSFIIEVDYISEDSRM